MAALFEPFKVRGVTLKNQVCVSSMSQYRAKDGDANDWHDGQIAGMSRITQFLKAEGAAAGVQPAHAGRKSSERRPWHGETLVDGEDVKPSGEAGRLGPAPKR